MKETIQARIQNDMKSALKGGDKARKDALSYLLSELQGAAKARQITELPDTESVALLQKQTKKVQETLEAAIKGSRADAATQSARELVIIREFLPEAPSAEAIEGVARGVIADLAATSMRDMGRVLAEVANRLPGVDKSAASAVVKRLLTPA